MLRVALLSVGVPLPPAHCMLSCHYLTGMASCHSLTGMVLCRCLTGFPSCRCLTGLPPHCSLMVKLPFPLFKVVASDVFAVCMLVYNV